jgi:hypothetical protein
MTAQLNSAPGPAELDAARLLPARMGISPADLLQAAPSRPVAPTFAEYIPVVSAAVTAGTRRVYGSYWNRILDQWGQRRLDEPTPSDVERLVGNDAVVRDVNCWTPAAIPVNTGFLTTYASQA